MSIYPDIVNSIDDEIKNTTDEDTEEITDDEEVQDLPTFKEYAWDFEKNDFILQDGKFVVLEGKEALKIWIYKAIKTSRYKYLAYSWEYGSEFEDIQGGTFDNEAIESECRRMLEECLSTNRYVNSIDSLEVNFTDNILSLNATINTVYGEVDINV